MRFVTLLVAVIGLSGCSLPTLPTSPPASTQALQATVPPSVRHDVQSGLADQFGTFDEDRSGDVTVEELPVLMANLDMSACWEDWALQRWLDTDRDGRVSRAEFASPAMVELALAALQQGCTLTSWNDYWFRHVYDGWWFINGFNYAGPDVRAAFDRLDVDHDGFLTTWETLRVADRPLPFNEVPMRRMRPDCP